MVVERRGAQESLGRLTAVEPRRIWPNEALDFTPWLRENIGLLGEALGLDLEIHEAEVAVGGFSVDLVGDDVTNGRRLIVENQLEATDHNHLGQLLTYAGGLDAATIVWVSTAVREEHRQALDWLNRHTDEGVSFFGVAVEVVRIGDSSPAVNFKPVAVPNDWGRSVKRAADQGEASALALARQRFFQAALAAVKAKRPGLTNASRVGLYNWFSTSVGRTGFGVYWTFTGSRELRVELYIDAGSAEENVGYLHALLARREELEQAAGRALEWDPIEGKRASRVFASRPVGTDAPDEDAELLAWAVDTMIAFHDAFRVPIRTLKPLQAPAPEA
jgi:hypothetical protein